MWGSSDKRTTALEGRAEWIIFKSIKQKTSLSSPGPHLSHFLCEQKTWEKMATIAKQHKTHKSRAGFRPKASPKIVHPLEDDHGQFELERCKEKGLWEAGWKEAFVGLTQERRE